MTENGGSTARVANRYRLERRIGRGGAGAVWRAHDENLDRKVAVKQIAIASESEGSSRSRALREARAAARLHVPNVVQVFDVIEEAGNVYLIMELVEAPNLSALVRREGPLAPRDVAALGLQMLDALEAAHRAGIVHRDVKPSNVLIHRDTARLTDFGIARLADDPTLTATGVVMGTPAYIAPEYAQGSEVGPAVDYYGLGATLYYAVEGRSPFSADGSLSTVMAVINSPPRPLTKAGPLTGLISALLEKDPRARPSPEEIRAQLHEIVGQSGPLDISIRKAPWVGGVAAGDAGDDGVDTAEDVTPKTGVAAVDAAPGAGVGDGGVTPAADAAPGDGEVPPEAAAGAEKGEDAGDAVAAGDAAGAGAGTDDAAGAVAADAGAGTDGDAGVAADAGAAAGAAPDAGPATDDASGAVVADAGAATDGDADVVVAAADAGAGTEPRAGAVGADDDGAADADPAPPREAVPPLSATLERSRTTERDAPGDRPSGREPGGRRRMAILASVLGLLVVAAIGVNSFFNGRQGASDDASQPAVAAPPSETRTAGEDGDTGEGAAPPADASPSEPSEPAEETAEDAGEEGDEGDGVLPATDAEIPDDWVEYAPDGGPYRLWHPPGWRIEPGEGNLTDIRDPDTGMYLRLDWVEAQRDPVSAWERTAEGFSRRYSSYDGVGITPTTYKGDPAALWEYRYQVQGAQLHAYNLGVNKGEYGFALNLQARESDWDRAQELWPLFLSGYEFTGP